MGEFSDVEKLILKEIRSNRAEIAHLREEVTTMKVKFATITAVVSTVFGLIGAYIKGKLGS